MNSMATKVKKYSHKEALQFYYSHSSDQLKMDLQKYDIISEGQEWTNDGDRSIRCKLNGCTIVFFKSTGRLKIFWQEKSEHYPQEKREAVLKIFKIFKENPDSFPPFKEKSDKLFDEQEEKEEKERMTTSATEIQRGAKKQKTGHNDEEKEENEKKEAIKKQNNEEKKSRSSVNSKC